LHSEAQLEQADGTSWMGMYALNLMDMAIEISMYDEAFEDTATKFFEHFVLIAEALNEMGMWNDEDKFYYDTLGLPGHAPIQLRIQSIVGLTSLFAVSIINKQVFQKLQDFTKRINWFEQYRKKNNKFWPNEEKVEEDKILISLIPKERLIALLQRLLNETEFLSPGGIRALSKYHEAHPYTVNIEGTDYSIQYDPGDSTSDFFGGNSNWRGPVWMPINYDVNVNFEAMGFGATFRYITQVKEYSIKVNPAYVVKPTIIEERLHKDWAKEINKEKISTPKLALSSDITRKKLKKVLKELDKEEKKEVKEEFSSDYTFTVDSTASSKKEEFWASERQVPLTEAEVNGYKEADSLSVQDGKKRLKDSVNALPKFRYGDIFNARTYSYGQKGIGARLSLSGFQSGYNAVDGASLGRSVDYRFTYKLADYWGTGFDVRYAFSRKTWNGSVYAERNWDENRQRVRISGGSSVLQVNNTEPISTSVNLIYALFFSQNYLKLYQKDFIQAFYSYQLNAKWNVSSTLEYRNRSSLVNHESTGFFFKERTFESNGDSFAANSQLLTTIRLRYQPLASWRASAEESRPGDLGQSVGAAP
jgi:hypothetical protein